LKRSDHVSQVIIGIETAEPIREGCNVQYMEAVARAGIVADTTGRSVFVVGWLDHYAVLSHEPKVLVGRNCYEVRPLSASSTGLSRSANFSSVSASSKRSRKSA
jgi:hypothetical protein